MRAGMKIVDVAIIGAGIAGLTCAQQVQQAGYRVAVIEKSRGLGGRVATRRLAGTWADHGARCLEQQGEQTSAWIQQLLQTGSIQFWTNKTYELCENQIIPTADTSPRYVAPNGITQIAKHLATGLTIYYQQRVIALLPTAQGWKFTLESTAKPAPDLLAKAIVVAIPAPQALDLLEPLAQKGLSDEIVANLRSVEFDPCITAIAVYTPEHQAAIAAAPWQAIRCTQDSVLSWIGLESSKRSDAEQPVIVAQSTAPFARQYFEAADLLAVGQTILDRAAAVTFPWVSHPQVFQVHRWRFAFVSRSLSESHLVSLSPLPLVCSGEWCGGTRIEDALKSGQAAAAQILQLLGAS